MGLVIVPNIKLGKGNNENNQGLWIIGNTCIVGGWELLELCTELTFNSQRFGLGDGNKWSNCAQTLWYSV